MFDYVYHILSQIGYSHPLHPVFVHLPVGLTIGGFIFSLLGFLMKRKAFLRSSVHLIGMALFFLPFAVLTGYMDWVHFYASAMLFEFKMKFALGALLFLFLSLSLFISNKYEEKYGYRFLFYILSFLTVSGLGYFGGELVYASGSKASGDKNTAVSQIMSKEQQLLIAHGKKIYNQRCAACHYADKTDKKIGPGMKGIMNQKFFPTSNWPVNEENLIKQIQTPFQAMPAFKDLPESDMNALVEYLKML